MLRRCKDAQNPSYGGRGIKVCEQWHDFVQFDKDTGPMPEGDYSIDRINNDGNYEPGNVRWATPRQQQNNQRRNRLLTFDGKTQTWSQWARELGINKVVIRRRFLKGWPVEKILSKQDFRVGKFNP